MFRPLRAGLCALGALLGAVSAQAAGVVVEQSVSATYVKFDAGSYYSLTNTETSVITDNGNGTLTTTARNDSSPAVLTYSITFTTAETYALYFNQASASLSTDSIFIATGFNVTPSATETYNWNNLESGSASTFKWSSLPGTTTGGTSTGVYGSTATLFTVASAGTYTFTILPRETGLVWGSFVFSTDTTLTASALSALTNSSTSLIPEPSSSALLVGFGTLGLVLLRRRRAH